MPENFLNALRVGTTLEQMRRKRMPQRMNTESRYIAPWNRKSQP